MSQDKTLLLLEKEFPKGATHRQLKDRYDELHGGNTHVGRDLRRLYYHGEVQKEYLPNRLLWHVIKREES